MLDCFIASNLSSARNNLTLHHFRVLKTGRQTVDLSHQTWWKPMIATLKPIDFRWLLLTTGVEMNEQLGMSTYTWGGWHSGDCCSSSGWHMRACWCISGGGYRKAWCSRIDRQRRQVISGTVRPGVSVAEDTDGPGVTARKLIEKCTKRLYTS
jgi:hypothetical protein